VVAEPLHFGLLCVDTWGSLALTTAACIPSRALPTSWLPGGPSAISGSDDLGPPPEPQTQPTPCGYSER
jgi:hypothetical protein